MDDKDNKNNSDSQSLIKLIKNTGYEQFYELGSKEQIICQQPVIVGTVSSDGGKATIAFPSDPTYFTTLQFENCTGTKLEKGKKVYLQHKFDNPSQGWLVSNAANYAIGSVTNIPSGVTWGNLNVRQVGNIVSVESAIRLSTPITNNNTSGNISKFMTLGYLSGVGLPVSTLVNFVGVPDAGMGTIKGQLGTYGRIDCVITVLFGNSVSGFWFNFVYIL